MMQRDARLTARKNHKEKTFQWLWHRNKDVNEKFTPAHMCKELGKLCKCRAWMWKRTRTFGGFKRRATSFCVAGVAPCDIIRCRKSFCLTGAILLRGGQKMSCILWSAGLDSWTLLISVVGEDAAQSSCGRGVNGCWMGFGFWGKEKCLEEDGWFSDTLAEIVAQNHVFSIYLLRSKAPSHLFLPVCLSGCLFVYLPPIHLSMRQSLYVCNHAGWHLLEAVCQCVTCVSSVDFFCPSTSSTAFLSNTLEFLLQCFWACRVGSSCVAEHATQSSRTGGAHGVWVGQVSGVEICTCSGPSRCLPTELVFQAIYCWEPQKRTGEDLYIVHWVVIIINQANSKETQTKPNNTQNQTTKPEQAKTGHTRMTGTQFIGGFLQVMAALCHYILVWPKKQENKQSKRTTNTHKGTRIPVPCGDILWLCSVQR